MAVRRPMQIRLFVSLLIFVFFLSLEAEARHVKLDSKKMKYQAFYRNLLLDIRKENLERYGDRNAGRRAIDRKGTKGRRGTRRGR